MKRMMKFITFLAAAIAAGGAAAGMTDRQEQKKQERAAGNCNHKYHGIYEKYLKRPADFMLAAWALVVLSPVMAAATLLIKVKLGSPVLFSQERPGKDGKIFLLRKFRSMTEDRGEDGKLLPDDVRLTKFGKALRRTSIDELPELFNILKGDMSIVGPRPLLTEYLPYYDDVEKHRHDVRPGLTGLAQVSGRNMLDWRERFAFDVKYAESVSFMQDLKIVILTLRKVLSHSDVLADTSKAEPNFAEERREEMENV